MSGVFRRVQRPQPKRQFIPTSAPTTSTSLLVSKKINLTCFEKRFETYYSQRKTFIPTATPSVPTSLLAHKKQVIQRREEHRRIEKRYIPSLTPSVSASILFKPKQDLRSFYNRPTQQNKKPYISTLDTTPKSLLLRKIHPERLIFKAEADKLNYHYKVKDQSKILGTVTPPPGTGSLLYRSKPNEVALRIAHSTTVFNVLNPTMVLDTIGGVVYPTVYVGIESHVHLTKGVNSHVTLTKGVGSNLNLTKGLKSHIDSSKGLDSEIH